MHELRPRDSILSASLPRTALLAIILVGWLAGASASASQRITPVVRAVQQVSPSVVNIHGQKSVRQSSDGKPSAPRQVNGMGTGVVIDPRGYVLTNFHVVDGVRRIHVTLSSGQSYIARLEAHDKETDLALIRIRCNSRLPVARVGTSDDLMPGETVIAVGNAFGYENTVTTGIISALHRNVQVNETQQYLDLIQTDASINPGNSGGPLLNIDGEMIGLNVAVRAGAQGIGFAIPIDKALKIATRLLSIEKIDNHWHGMTARLNDGPRGPVTVTRVVRDGPADVGGLQRGDQLERIGDLTIRRPIDIERALLGRDVNDRVPTVVRRNGERMTLSLTVATRGTAPSRVARQEPNNTLQQATWETLGLRLKRASRGSFRHRELPYEGGMRVVAVRPGSSAAEQGVQQGDVLVKLHRWTTTSSEDIRFIVGHADALARTGGVKFYIIRNDQSFFGHLTVASGRNSALR